MSMAEVEMLRAACCVAGLDAEIDEREAAYLERLAERAGVGKASLNAMVSRASKDQNFYREQFRVLRSEPMEVMKTLFAVAIMDGVLSVDERVILHHFAEKLNMSEEDFNRILAAAERKLRQ